MYLYYVMGTILLYTVDKKRVFFFFDRIKGEYSLILSTFSKTELILYSI